MKDVFKLFFLYTQYYILMSSRVCKTMSKTFLCVFVNLSKKFLLGYEWNI